MDELTIIGATNTGIAPGANEIAYIVRYLGREFLVPESVPEANRKVYILTEKLGITDPNEFINAILTLSGYNNESVTNNHLNAVIQVLRVLLA